MRAPRLTSMTKDRSKLFADSWLRRVDSREDDLFRPTGPGERDVAATVLSWTPGCDFQSSSRGLTLRCDDREEVDKWLALPGLLGTGSCGEFPRWRFNRPKLCFSQGRSSSSLSSTSSPLLLLWTSVQLPFLAPSPLPGSTRCRETTTDPAFSPLMRRISVLRPRESTRDDGVPPGPLHPPSTTGGEEDTTKLGAGRLFLVECLSPSGGAGPTGDLEEGFVAANPLLNVKQ